MKTIAAIATAQGQGGVAMIRVSGDDAIDVSDKIFISKYEQKLKNTKGYTARYGKIIDGDTTIDEAVALVFRAPNSYTGENVVEISCHGGNYVVKQVLELIFKAGASPAEPGEFTKRAFLNGKMDLTKAESVMDIISASGKKAAKLAVSMHEGALYKKIDDIKSSLVNMAAHLSVWSDYPEEDIPEVEIDVLKENINLVKISIKKLLAGYDTGKIIKSGIDTVIIGRPNVGKSTLMNLIAGCERSIVTDIPGTTRDMIEEKIILGDVVLNVSDTAGIRYTDDPIEKIGVDRARNKIKSVDLVIFVFDNSQPLHEDEITLLKSLPSDAISIGIINKIDLKCNIDIKKISETLNKVVDMSAVKGEGLESLNKAISDLFGITKVDPSEGILASERQRFFVNSAYSAITEASEALNSGVTLDAIEVSIEFAIAELMKLTGEKATDAIIDEVFSKFCVGK